MESTIQKIFRTKVTILGAGRSGQGAAALLAAKGALVFLSDSGSVDMDSDSIMTLDDLGVEIESGGHTDRIYYADFWVISPAIPVDHPLVQTAKEKGIPVYGELEVASWFNLAQMIAVTGSNGKSTTTALIGEIFKQAGWPTVVAGNIGTSFAAEVLDTHEEGVAVLEVSNFQLETIESFHPEIALFLNLTPDHLDRHGTMETYGNLKARIFENQTETDWLIYSAEDEWVRTRCASAKSKKATFGFSPSGERCGFVRDETLVLSFAGKEESLLPIRKMGIRGPHNILNALAASLAARLMDVPLETIQKTLRTFKGLPHRLEFVRELDGVKWINDSKATNTDSVWYALGSYTEPIVWIAGGRDKHSDFSLLNKRIRERVKSIILIGEAALKMAKVYSKIRPVHFAKTFEESIRMAQALSEPGDVVLLSPACASFDMFRNYEDRGEQFKQQVNRL